MNIKKNKIVLLFGVFFLLQSCGGEPLFSFGSNDEDSSLLKGEKSADVVDSPGSNSDVEESEIPKAPVQVLRVVPLTATVPWEIEEEKPFKRIKLLTMVDLKKLAKQEEKTFPAFLHSYFHRCEGNNYLCSGSGNELLYGIREIIPELRRLKPSSLCPAEGEKILSELSQIDWDNPGSQGERLAVVKYAQLKEFILSCVERFQINGNLPFSSGEGRECVLQHLEQQGHIGCTNTLEDLGFLLASVEWLAIKPEYEAQLKAQLVVEKEESLPTLPSQTQTISVTTTEAKTANTLFTNINTETIAQKEKPFSTESLKYVCPYEWNKDNEMENGARKVDVLQLQRLLNTSDQTRVAEEGPGSPGKETKYFGSLTEAALIKFQDLFGLDKTGRLDKATIEKLNELCKGL